jgi:hypothetical protein
MEETSIKKYTKKLTPIQVEFMDVIISVKDEDIGKNVSWKSESFTKP